MNISQIRSLFNTTFRGKSRTSIIIQNLSVSMSLKMVSIILSFVMVPISLDYLSKARYGLWAALSSVLAWFFIFDIGIGNGLRNKYIELKAKGRIKEIRNYVSTAYFLFSIMGIVIIIVFFFINIFVDWGEILNAPETLTGELSKTALIVFVIMVINFVARLINTILQADLKTGISDSFNVIAYAITLFGIIILIRTTKPSLLNFALLYTGSNLLDNAEMKQQL